MDFFDTMIADYLLNPGNGRHNLNDLAKRYLNYDMIKYNDIVEKNNTFDNIDIDIATQYASEDADITFQLYKILYKKLEEEDLLYVFEKIEMPLLFVLKDMEKDGIKINKKYLNELSKKFEKDIFNLEKEIYKNAEEEFNINSNQQMQYILFEKLKLPTQKKTKTGYSTNVQVLEKLKDKHKIINLILEYRTLQKLKNTYIDTLPTKTDENDKIHTNFNQTITATGRLSSSNPNLQNIPIKTFHGQQIRKAFIPENINNVLLSADYSQVELRLLAHFSQDEKLIKAYKENLDIHKQTASYIFKKDIEKISKEERRFAKTINFGIIYGMGPFKLSQELNIKLNEAKEFISNYFSIFPNIQSFIDLSISKAREQGYVQTLFGRKRYLPDINNFNQMIAKMAEREAVNTIIQGSCADIIKIAMINISNKIKENNLKTKLVLQIHDELVFDIPKNELNKIKDIIKYEMENVCKLDIDLKVDLNTGANWLEAH